MNPVTHLLASWTLAEASSLSARDRNLITWCGICPDLDGFGLVVDAGSRLLGRAQSFWYQQYHHAVLHGLFGAALIPAVLAVRAKHRLPTFLFGTLAVHLHLVCDLVGSRGPTAADIWPLYYFAPFSRHPEWSWSGQWALNAWPNLLFTAVLLLFASYRAIVTGRSPLSLFTARGDARLLEKLRASRESNSN